MGNNQSQCKKKRVGDNNLTRTGLRLGPMLCQPQKNRAVVVV